MVSVRYYTDPVCPWSWGIEPSVRKLMVEFGDALGWTFVMGGLARDLSKEGIDRAEGGLEQVYGRLIREWLIAADRTGMPFDPLLWVESPITTSYPACMAVKAATDQATDNGYRYLRRLREGLICERRKLDHVEALVEEGRKAGLDVGRFRIDLRSHGTTEAFGSDLEDPARLGDAGAQPDERFLSRTSSGAPIPALAFSGEGGRRWVIGFQPYEAFRDAALAAGAEPQRATPMTVEEALARFDRVSGREVEALCELPPPRVGAELFRLAEQWKARPVWRMTGYMWEAA
jgi:protein-disulfide isomerase-like protein with CxxC motif